MRYFDFHDDGITKVLRDASGNGKVRDWKGKKQRSLLMSEHYYHAELYGKAKRMSECANVLTFVLTDQGLKLNQCWFCKVRLCPMCNWRRSLKLAFQNKKIVEEANRRYKLVWLFLTLTVRNCEGEELKETVENMMKAWNRFVGYSRLKKVIQGYFRALEITKDTDKVITKKRYYRYRSYYDKRGLKPGDLNPNYGTYHPHFHVLLAVSPSYFGKLYVKQSEWVKFWQKAMRLDYEPIVDIRRVKPKKNVDLEKVETEVKEAIKEMREQKALLEVSKYPVKDADVLISDRVTAEGVETVYTLDDAISYKRLIGYGGILKELHRELNLDDPEDGDLIKVSDEDEVANGICEVMAYWHVGIKDYVIKLPD